MILIVSSVFPPEPVVSAIVAKDLAEVLSEYHKVTVISPRPTRPLGFLFKCESENIRNYEHIILNSYTCPESKLFGRMRESFSFGKHVVNYIKRNYVNIQCIFVHAWPLFAQYLIVKTATKFSIPVVTHVVDIYPEALTEKLPFLKNLIYKFLVPIDKYVLRRSLKVITISPNMKSYLVKTRGLEGHNVEVIYNWQNEEWFLQYKASGIINKTSGQFTFMYLGNLSRTAALDNLIYAFDKSGIEDSRLIIAGNGSEKEALIDIAKSCNNNNISFRDAPMKLVPEIQGQADVLILSLKKGASLYALPSKLSAYMFSEKPIIACVEEESDTAGAIRAAGCGWIVEPQSIDALVEVMKKAAFLPVQDIRNIGRNGAKYSWNNYSRKVNLDKMAAIVKGLVNSWKT